MTNLERLGLVWLIIINTYAVISYDSMFAPASEPPTFKPNYQIDLQPEGYSLLDEYGGTHWVEFGELEEYLIEDNK